ncbi:hypothetical protein DWU98_03940 [Dyella monticola]|uniref:Uncharacterized protein n=1 Tax=Dyella monticola TaxID=1927958 RepID=A0A370X508_9GAMM|nr:hypothetical protein [Dyella monticola]RDS83504.1 hypothetical protein DWU98_03940 [Dyella monticola]
MAFEPEFHLNPTVKAALTALQAGDALAWLGCFTAKAKLFEDGKRADLYRFTREKVGWAYFTSLDHVREDGRHVYGRLHVRQRGVDRVYFKFRLDSTAMCSRLDVGHWDGNVPHAAPHASAAYLSEDELWWLDAGGTRHNHP